MTALFFSCTGNDLQSQDPGGLEDADLGFGIGDPAFHDVPDQVGQRDGIDIQELVGIQVLRLEFYEMFSRFYEGGGRPFVPVTSRRDGE